MLEIIELKLESRPAYTRTPFSWSRSLAVRCGNRIPSARLERIDRIIQEVLSFPYTRHRGRRLQVLVQAWDREIETCETFTPDSRDSREIGWDCMDKRYPGKSL